MSRYYDRLLAVTLSDRMYVIYYDGTVGRNIRNTGRYMSSGHTTLAVRITTKHGIAVDIHLIVLRVESARTS